MSASNYAAGTPTGKNQNPLYGSPAPFKAIEQYFSENATASSVVTLTDNTTAIEIAASAAPVYMRWVPVTETAGVSPFGSVVVATGAGGNFDHVIPANTVRRFVVPIEVSTQSIQVGNTITSQVGARVENGLFARVAYKTQGPASVAATEYGSSNSY